MGVSKSCAFSLVFQLSNLVLAHKRRATEVAEKRVVKNYIDGKSQESVSGQFTDLINPTTGGVFAMAALSNEKDVVHLDE